MSSSHIPSATFFSSQQNDTADLSTEKCPPGQRLWVGPLPMHQAQWSPEPFLYQIHWVYESKCNSKQPCFAELDSKSSAAFFGLHPAAKWEIPWQRCHMGCCALEEGAGQLTLLLLCAGPLVGHHNNCPVTNIISFILRKVAQVQK